MRIPLQWLDRIQVRFGFRIYFLLSEDVRTYAIDPSRELVERPVIGLRLVFGNENIHRYHARIARKYPVPDGRIGMDA